jgi:hypothetical protein
VKNHSDLFYRWMKNNLSEQPSSTLDENILAMASKKLGSAQQSSSLAQWLKPSLTLAFGIALVIVINIYSNRQNEMAKAIITESPEMVLHYKDIELMADAGALSEEDWKKIEGIK